MTRPPKPPPCRYSAVTRVGDTVHVTCDSCGTSLLSLKAARQHADPDLGVTGFQGRFLAGGGPAERQRLQAMLVVALEGADG